MPREASKQEAAATRNTGFSVPTPKPCDRRLCAGIRRLQRRRLWTAGAMLPLSKRRHSRRTPKLQALTTLRAPTRFAHALLLPKTVLLRLRLFAGRGEQGRRGRGQRRRTMTALSHPGGYRGAAAHYGRPKRLAFSQETGSDGLPRT
jgi:hypothetical protein